MRRSLVAAVAIAVLTMPGVLPASPAPFDSAESRLLAQGGPFDSAEAGLPAQGALSQLRGVEELRSWFNTFKGRTRLIFLLSPT